MAIATYSDLQTAIARWIGNSDSATPASEGLTSTIADLITIAESRIFREARTKDTEAVLSGTTALGLITVPSDYISLKFVYGSSPATTIAPRSAEWIYTNYPRGMDSGIPKYIARDASSFIFGPYPDSNYTISGVYYKRLAALSTTAHALFTNNPDLYLFAALAEATILIGRDDRIPVWEQKYKMILNAVNGVDKTSETANAPLQMRVA